MNDAVPRQAMSDMEMSVAGCILDLAREELIDAEGRVIELRPQAYQVLLFLAVNAGRLVTKSELIAAVWMNVVVTDDSLVQAIVSVRRALKDERHELIKTVSRRGYIMAADGVRRHAPAADIQPTTPAAEGGAEMPTADPVLVAHRRPSIVAAGAFALAIAGVFGWWLVSNLDPEMAPAAINGKPSIAVLAFHDPLATAEGNLVARGVAKDLATELARSHDLRVVSHQSSFAFDGKSVPLAEIGRRLRSRYLVDGTVAREGNSLRLVVELLDSQDGHIVWSSAQLLDHSSVFTARDALVRRIAGTVQTRLHRTEERRALTRPPGTMDVYTLTGRGNEVMHRYNAAGMIEARGLLESALRIDPNYARAWVFLGMVNTIDSALRLTGDWNPARMPEVIAQVNRALALEPDLPVAYVALSQAQALARDFEAALGAARRCLELAPNDADCLYIMGKASLELGHLHPAVQFLEQALDLNPVSPVFLPSFYATALWGLNRADEALRATDECLAKAPDLWRCRQDRIVSLVDLGRIGEAQAETRALLGQVPTMTAQRFALAFADSAGGLRERRIAAALAAGIPRAAPQ
ncbi:MAG: winged helix-turn-helix domain-containing protein [Betaproteobacteria bacterium]